MSIRCGNCRSRHETVHDVRECYQASSHLGRYLGPCTWVTEKLFATGDPDEPFYWGFGDCGSPMHERKDGTGYECLAGHEHTYMEARAQQGWDYAADEDEAYGLARAGVEPRTMAGQTWPR